MIEYQRNDIVQLSNPKFEDIKGQLWYSDNAFAIAEVGQDGMASLKEFDAPIPVSEIQPLPINKKRAGNVYYDPVIAASVVSLDDVIPVYSVDYTYFMDSFERVIEEDGSTLLAHVEEQKFKYVHEVQHWLRERYGSDDLKIYHRIITMAEAQFRNLWKLRDSLLYAGVSSYQFLYEMANMLYLRWMSFFDDAEYANWRELEQTTGDALLDKYQKAMHRINQQTRIYSASVLAQAISEVSRCAKQENIAEVFDMMLQENSRIKDGGAIQNSTPRVLSQLLVEVMQPQLWERWHDPAAGFSGFLVEIDKYLRKNNGNYQALNEEEKAFQITEALSGMEIQNEVARIGFCNTRFHGLWCRVLSGDSLMTSDYKRYDGILCEPPMPSFSLTEKSKSGSNRQTAFVDLILDSLDLHPDSRAAIILPESFLTKSSSDYRYTRRRLFGNFVVHTILRLPKGIYPNTSISMSMCVIFVKCGYDHDRDLLVYDMQSGKLKPEQLQKISVFDGFIKAYRSRTLDKRCLLYSLDEIRDKDYQLSFGVNGEREQQQLESPSHYLTEANKIVKDIRNLLSKMDKEIND